MQKEQLLIQINWENSMEFVKFKRYIDSIKKTLKKEEKVSGCIQKYLSTSTYCIVDISSDAIYAIIGFLADYYDCHYNSTTYKSNDIEWWLFERVDKIITITDHAGKEEQISVKSLHNFWKFLEDNRNKKIKEGTYKYI